MVDGKIIPMANATGKHNVIGNYFMMFVEPHLLQGGGECFSYTNDIRVKINKHKYRYPDFLVDCSGEMVEVYAKNPVLIGEVLSESTENEDKFIKIEEYKTISSVQEIFFAYQTEKKVIVHTRKSSVSLLWTTKEYTEGLIHLKSINFSVSIDDIYKRVVFDNI